MLIAICLIEYNGVSSGDEGMIEARILDFQAEKALASHREAEDYTGEGAGGEGTEIRRRIAGTERVVRNLYDFAGCA